MAAAEEERFTRVKHASGLPVQALRWVLDEAGVTGRDVAHLAVSRNPHTHRPRRALHGLARSLRSGRLPRGAVQSRAQVAAIPSLVREALHGDLPAGVQAHYVEHHPAHVASAFFASGFDDAAVCSIDGLGDFVSMAWGTGQGNDLEIAGRVFFPHSLGFFYTAVTQYLGFPEYGDEYKVMALASYGTPRYLPEMRRILKAGSKPFRLDLRYFRHGRQAVPMAFDGGAPAVGKLFAPALEDLLGPPRDPAAPLDDRHRDIAASAQARLEEVLLPFLDRLQRETGRTELALAGGVALNVTANSRIRGATGFDEIYVQPAANDAGTSLGAALYVAHATLRQARSFRMTHAYYGPAFTSGDCARALDGAGLGYDRLPDDELCRRTAQLIAQGKVVGWFQGRMEFGPRALGNRSIVCDPRDARLRDTLNARTKRREAFRPFAPSVLAERAADVYDHDGASPFMLFAPAVRPAWRDRLPAVTHVDGTGRIQTVHRETNERFWKLLRAFDILTGVPVVLNTSFNSEEPIVCTPQQAISCFLRADIDVLVLEDLLVTRDGPHPARAAP